MIRTIIKREFLDNILSFKFIACVLVAIVLVVISTTFLAKDYKDRLKDYDVGVAASTEALTKVPVYSYLRVRIFKNPNPLSIFVSGIERETGNYIDLSHRDIPASLKGGRITNEFSHMLSFFDLNSIIALIFSILAILLSYNAFSGEKEDGTLSLVLANPVPRYKFLLGKYLGMLATLAVPLALSFGIGLLIASITGIQFNRGAIASIALIFVHSIFYLSALLLIGIFISSRTNKSFMSLLVLLAFYLASIIVIPTALKGLTENTIALKARHYEKEIQSLLDQRANELNKKTGEMRPPGTWSFRETTREGGIILKRINPPALIEFMKRLYLMQEKTIENYALKINALRENDGQIIDKARGLENGLLLLNPTTNFSRSAELISDTGEDNLKRFFGELTFYWHQYVHYLDEKNAFGLRYFYPYTEELTREEKELIENINRDYDGDPWKPYGGKYAQRAQSHNPEFHNLDLSDLPEFSFKEPAIATKIGMTLPNILILFVYNLLFLTLSHFSFTIYDPRRQ